MPNIHISIQEADFDPGTELTTLTQGDTRAGAVVSFMGLVRDLNEGSGVSEMTLEHYPGMTEKALRVIVDEACARWTLHAVRVIHRIGKLLPCDRIVLVAVSSAHRGDAFTACEFIMDYLKTQAPFWKREVTPQGARWVDAREADGTSAARWG